MLSKLTSLLISNSSLGPKTEERSYLNYSTYIIPSPICLFVSLHKNFSGPAPFYLPRASFAQTTSHLHWLHKFIFYPEKSPENANLISFLGDSLAFSLRVNYQVLNDHVQISVLSTQDPSCHMTPPLSALCTLASHSAKPPPPVGHLSLHQNPPHMFQTHP